MWITDPEDVNTLRSDGEAGELIVEGRALVSRYIYQPEQSARAFLESLPWMKSSSADTRFYRTGDLARKEADGSFTFFGRQDGQMSFHGERVELGEIDYHLDQFSGPKGADCLADFDTSAQHVVGFVCGRSGKSDTSTASSFELLSWEDSVVPREELEQKMKQVMAEGNLPDYVVPKWWLAVPMRPLTISHKTNQMEMRALLKGLNKEQCDMYCLGLEGDH